MGSRVSNTERVHRSHEEFVLEKKVIISPLNIVYFVLRINGMRNRFFLFVALRLKS